MLTITFINGNDRQVVSCDSYVVEGQEDETYVDVKKGFGKEALVETFVISPNAEEDWPVAYVTNLAGKTIDRIGG